ncbi:MAG: acyl-CoA dehydrogenase family protein [Pseudomonadota bacterium]
MFDMTLGEELALIRDQVRRFATGVLSERQREFEDAHAVPESVQTDFAALGLAALELPETLGGAGLGALAKALVLEELGAGDPGAALALDTPGAALYPLLELGGEAALAAHVVPLLDRPGARALLVWGGGERPGGGRKPLCGTHTCDGTIPWVPAQGAELVVVLDGEGAAVLDSGYRFTPVKGSGLRAAGAAQLEFIDAPIRERWRDRPGAARALARWQLHTAALLVGLMRTAAETSREYAMQRVAFGKPIAHHQALAFLIADMHSAVEATRLLVQEAAWRADRGLPFAGAAATAFVEAVEAGMFVTPNALQIFGGQGFMQDLPLEKYLREARTLGLMAGGVDLAREIAGAEVAASAGGFDLSPILAEEP